MSVSDTEQVTHEGEILLAIATAFHLERNHPEGRQHLSVGSDDQSPWTFTGRLQQLTSRKNIQIRSRK